MNGQRFSWVVVAEIAVGVVAGALLGGLVFSVIGRR